MTGKRAIAVLISSVLIGCSPPKPDHPGVTPQPPERTTVQRLATMDARLHAIAPVFDSFATALDEIRSKYPEMAGYQKETAKGQAEDAIWCGYSHKFTRPTVKRAVLPSDFGDHGFTTGLSCKATLPPDSAYTMLPPTLNLSHLRFYVWAEVQTAPNPSPGIVDEVNAIIQVHLGKLKAIDEAVSNQRIERDP